MNATDSLEALRRTNPRRTPHYNETLDRLTTSALDRLALGRAHVPAPVERPSSRRSRRRLARPGIAISTGVALVAAAVIVTVVFVVGSPVGPTAIPPAAAMERAVAHSATAADKSGIVRIELTQDGALWATETVHWNGDNVSLSDQQPTRSGGDLLLVDGMVYAKDLPDAPEQWHAIGSPDSFEPDSGTTPTQFLAAAREDAGGSTLRRITAAMTDLITVAGQDGSTVYRGHVAAGELARETGFKEGQAIRVLPYGYVAHDDASDPSSPIAMTITVGADTTIHSIVAAWGGSSTWVYGLTFTELGSASQLTAPADAMPFAPCRHAPAPGGC
jgi:hypothetical protein